MHVEQVQRSFAFTFDWAKLMRIHVPFRPDHHRRFQGDQINLQQVIAFALEGVGNIHQEVGGIHQSINLSEGGIQPVVHAWSKHHTVRLASNHHRAQPATPQEGVGVGRQDSTVWRVFERVASFGFSAARRPGQGKAARKTHGYSIEHGIRTGQIYCSANNAQLGKDGICNACLREPYLSG